MTRLLVRAALVALLAGLIIGQMEGSPLLWAWETLLVVLLLSQLRAIPGEEVMPAIPLFGARAAEATRLPRSVLSAEVAASDALSGQLGRDRRLRPMLVRIANHRLRRHGSSIEMPGALAFLDSDDRAWLLGESERAISPANLERFVTRLEDL